MLKVNLSFNTPDLRNILVIFYLISNLGYFQLEVKEKNTLIQELKIILNQKDKK